MPASSGQQASTSGFALQHKVHISSWPSTTTSQPIACPMSSCRNVFRSRSHKAPPPPLLHQINGCTGTPPRLPSISTRCFKKSNQNAINPFQPHGLHQAVCCTPALVSGVHGIMAWTLPTDTIRLNLGFRCRVAMRCLHHARHVVCAKGSSPTNPFACLPSDAELP